jgi:hypothetical protein
LSSCALPKVWSRFAPRPPLRCFQRLQPLKLLRHDQHGEGTPMCIAAVTGGSMKSKSVGVAGSGPEFGRGSGHVRLSPHWPARLRMALTWTGVQIPPTGRRNTARCQSLHGLGRGLAPCGRRMLAVTRPRLRRRKGEQLPFPVQRAARCLCRRREPWRLPTCPCRPVIDSGFVFPGRGRPFGRPSCLPASTALLSPARIRWRIMLVFGMARTTALSEPEREPDGNPTQGL